MSASTYNMFRSRLDSGQPIDIDGSFEIARFCSDLLARPDSEAFGRDLVIRALEAQKRFPAATREMWNELVAGAGLHPYVAADQLTGSSQIRHEFHRSDFLTDLYLHREQQELSSDLIDGRSLVLSAPTSFGKSLLIEEIVASKLYRNIVVVQPTLALLDETRKKFAKYSTHYQMVVSTHQQASAGANLFLFTAERVVEYAKFPQIDFFVIDEFYKLSLDRDDERAVTLNQALYLLLKHTFRFYLLGPNIKHISSEFLDRYDAKWVRSDYATVAVDVVEVFRNKGWKKKDPEREKQLYSLLRNLTGPTLVYCGTPDRALALADGYVKQLGEEAYAKNQKNQDLIEWIGENIHEKWSLTRALRASVAVHHGQLPRHLGSAIVDAFNEGTVRWLFCTSTLIEGVNTAARNVVLFDQHKGPKPIDFFDYKNIVGRSGRMRIHYVGRVFEFHEQPIQSELDVEVPLFAQGSAPLELLVQLDSADLDPAVDGRMSVFDAIDEDLKNVIKKNSGIPVLGQIAFVRELESGISQYHRLLAWNTIPKFGELKEVLELCWRFLLKSGESKAGVRSPAQLATLTLQYCVTKSLRALIERTVESSFWRERQPDEYTRVQNAVGLVLSVARQWFDYKLPKLLAAASELQKYVFEKAGMRSGNYSYLAALLENSFFDGLLSVLLDYDVPASALRKIERLFRSDTEWNTVEQKLRRTNFTEFGLLPYEIQKMKGALGSLRGSGVHRVR